ncbi:MAG: fimbrillin family protein [Prevotella sp.]|jgi:hypothetical protein|nr:fimbrillin family protein [Prevotella sp.]
MKFRISLGKGFSPLLFSSLITLCLAGCVENSSILDNGQRQQLEFSVSTHSWDNSDKSSDQKIPSRATPISTFDTSKSFNVIADVNKGGSWSTEVNNETVSYSTENKIWQTIATHYWPEVGSTVNFYAYYPTSILNNITHTTGSVPVLTYTVPYNATDQIDILASSKIGMTGDSYNQTPVDFKHIFAAVNFQVGSSGLPSGIISSITISDIKNSGVYTFGSGWTLNSGTKTFKVSSSTVISGISGENITSAAYTLMMIPQTFTDAALTLTYNTGTSYTKNISGSWSAGNSYTYNLSKIPGQYLFSDGTWGSYDANKTVIGIIFSNTTSSTDRSHGWTHGYAMALQDAGSAASTYYQWYSSNSGNPTGTNLMTADQIMSDKDGYAHSGYIQSSGYAAGITAHGYTAKDKSGNTVAAPSNTSGWYLPSIGQWYDICVSLGGMVTASEKAYTNSNTGWLRWYSGDDSSGKNYSSLCASNLNVYLNALKNKGYSVDLFSNNSEICWSSSEYDSPYTYRVVFGAGGGMILELFNKTDLYRVRSVIAF